MENLKNKYLLFVLLLLSLIIFLLYSVFFKNIEERMYSIFFLILSVCILLGEIFIYSNTKKKMDKVLFYSGSVVINIMYVLLTIVLSIFYKKFSSINCYINLNLIILLMNVLGFTIVYNISIKREEK